MQPCCQDQRVPKALLVEQVILVCQGSRETKEQQEESDSQGNPVVPASRGGWESLDPKETPVTSTLYRV